MSEITIKLAEKTFTAKLSIEAIERIEGAFDNLSLGAIMVGKGGGLRSGRAILTACILDQNESMTTKEINTLVDKEIEANGIDSLWEKIKALVEASGLYGKAKAKAAAAGN